MTSTNLQRLIEYIIEFLLPQNECYANRIGYTDRAEEFENYDIIIKPSGWFGSKYLYQKKSMPLLPLKKIDNTEILFGTERVAVSNGKVFVEADVVASTFFVVSRYEELINEEAFDLHNRFSASQSFLHRAGVLHKPIADHYCGLMRKWLRMAGHNPKEPPARVANVFLTHDIDTIGYYQSLRSMLSGIIRGNIGRKIEAIKSFFNPDHDPAYTFRWLIEQDSKVGNAQSIFFVKADGCSKGYDLPHYSLITRKFKQLADMIKGSCSQIGLHSSYASYKNPTLIKEEKERLENAIGKEITAHRSHYLRILPPYQPEFYLQAGLTKDFSLGFADKVGFRLGTCRPLQWINPKTFEIFPITIYPLTAMECTLSFEKYMNMDYNSALFAIKELIQIAVENNGALNFLWHNTEVVEGSGLYHRNLYLKLIDILQNIKTD